MATALAAAASNRSLSTPISAPARIRCYWRGSSLSAAAGCRPRSVKLRRFGFRATMSSSAAHVAGGNEVLVQYVVLRRDLIDTWPLGSVVTQGCHASVAAIWSHREDPATVEYCSPDNIDSMHKVTLEVKGEAQLLNLSEKLKAIEIAHKMWVEQPENIPTCLATKPYPKSLVSTFFKKLKLCK